MLIAQNIPRIGDNFVQISCLTAVTLDGRVLWQLGRPDPRNGLLTSDTPFQIHDLDGDGRNEVVMVKDFKLQVLEGATGKVRKSVPMPPRAAGQPAEALRAHATATALAFVNLSGSPRRWEMLVKDRYTHFWLLDAGLEPLWQGEGQTGHFPIPWDLDGDGRDEIAIGYALWDHAGHRLWSHDEDLKDHADGVAVGNFSDDPKAEPRVYAWGSDEGFLMFDRRGTILKHVRIGHAQTASVGKFLPDRPGPAIDVRQLLEEPRHRLAVRPRRQPPGPAGADPLRQPDAPGELARRRPGVRPALGQRPRGGHDRRHSCAGS